MGSVVYISTTGKKKKIKINAVSANILQFDNIFGNITKYGCTVK